MSNVPVILCVDDEPVGLHARSLLLSIAGYTVLTASSGKAALELFRGAHVDLVITDHWLPDITGVELAAEMKQLKPEVPIVLFSGLAELPLEDKHIDLYLTKGLMPPEFLAQVAKLLARKPPSETETM